MFTDFHKNTNVSSCTMCILFLTCQKFLHFLLLGESSKWLEYPGPWCNDNISTRFVTNILPHHKQVTEKFHTVVKLLVRRCVSSYFGHISLTVCLYRNIVFSIWLYKCGCSNSKILVFSHCCTCTVLMMISPVLLLTTGISK